MTESSVPHPIAAAVVAILMLGGIGYGVYRGQVKAPKEAEQLDQVLFNPYFKALSEGRIDEAWERYTTPSYKRLFPVESYRQHWQQTFAQAGHLVKRNLFVTNEAYELANQHEYTSVKYQLTFEHDYVQAVYEVVPDAQGGRRIDWAGQHESASSQTAPKPW